MALGFGLHAFGQFQEFLPIDPLLSQAPTGVFHLRAITYPTDTESEKGRKNPAFFTTDCYYDNSGHLIRFEQGLFSLGDSIRLGWESWPSSSDQHIWHFRDLSLGDTLDWELTRDSLDRIVQFAHGPDPFGALMSYRYGEDGNLVEVQSKSINTSSVSETFKFSYDESGRLIHVEEKRRWEEEIDEYEYHYNGDRLDVLRYKTSINGGKWQEQHYRYGPDGLIDKMNEQLTTKGKKVIRYVAYQYEKWK